MLLEIKLMASCYFIFGYHLLIFVLHESPNRKPWQLNKNPEILLDTSALNVGADPCRCPSLSAPQSRVHMGPHHPLGSSGPPRARKAPTNTTFMTSTSLIFFNEMDNWKKRPLQSPFFETYFCGFRSEPKQLISVSPPLAWPALCWIRSSGCSKLWRSFKYRGHSKTLIQEPPRPRPRLLHQIGG